MEPNDPKSAKKINFPTKGITRLAFFINSAFPTIKMLVSGDGGTYIATNLQINRNNWYKYFLIMD
jgi:hypothetical protein